MVTARRGCEAVPPGAGGAQRHADDAGWALAALTADVLESGVEGKVWAADIGASSAHVSTLKTLWVRYATQRREMSFRDAYSLAGSSEDVAEALQAEAKKTGLTVSAIRARASRGDVDIPVKHRDTLLPKLVMAKRQVERVAEAVRTTGPRQRDLTAHELEAIANIAGEIRDTAAELLRVLSASVVEGIDLMASLRASPPQARQAALGGIPPRS